MRYHLYGEDHHEIALSLNNVGIALEELGRHDEELEFKLKALKMREKIY